MSRETESKSVVKCAELGITPDMIRAKNLRACVEATELEIVEIGVDGREHLLVPAAAKAWRELKKAADQQGISLFVVSAFRSVDRQAEIVRRKLASGLTLEEILAVSAPPGYSEHHTGRAVDIGSPGAPVLDVGFEQSAAFAWLKKQAATFGYHLSYPRGNPWGYLYEPWHWCYEDTPDNGSSLA